MTSAAEALRGLPVGQALRAGTVESCDDERDLHVVGHVAQRHPADAAQLLCVSSELGVRAKGCITCGDLHQPPLLRVAPIVPGVQAPASHAKESSLLAQLSNGGCCVRLAGLDTPPGSVHQLRPSRWWRTIKTSDVAELVRMTAAAARGRLTVPMVLDVGGGAAETGRRWPPCTPSRQPSVNPADG